MPTPLPRASSLRRVQLLYLQVAVTWAWFMLDPWEVALVVVALLALAALVASACFAEASSYCSTAMRSLPRLVSSLSSRLSSSAL